MGTPTTAEEDIAVRAKDLLQSLHHPAAEPFLADWPGSYRRREVAATDLPVTRWLTEPGAHTRTDAAALAADAVALAADAAAIDRDQAVFGAGLVGALRRAVRSLAWRQTYSAADIDPAFLSNYGWSEIIGAVGPFESERIACGFLILGPGTFYPRHRHAAEELYVPLMGTAAWQQGDTVWREQPPGTPILHRSEEPHAMRTGAAPLLALYVWRGDGLACKAQLDAAGTQHGAATPR
jgi:hypothetical protein